MRTLQKNQKGFRLDEDLPVGPLEIARENLESFADNLIVQDSLRKMVEWMLVLRDILKDPDVSEEELSQTKEELELLDIAWSAIANSWYEDGISC